MQHCGKLTILHVARLPFPCYKSYAHSCCTAYAITLIPFAISDPAALYDQSLFDNLLGVRLSVQHRNMVVTISGWLHHHFLCSYIR